jgi:sterol desaturase/sphingolipid hydroxylase (fatty acid hydroxylase superfamily)
MKPFFYTPLAVAGVFILLFAVERFFPLRESRAGLIARLIVNASLSAVTFLVAVTVVWPSALLTLNWASARPFGLIHVVQLPVWAQFVAGFLLLDVSFHYWHIAVTLRIIWPNFLRAIWHNWPTAPEARERPKDTTTHSSKADTDAIKRDTREFGRPCLAG